MYEIISKDDSLSILKAKKYLFYNKPICAPTDTIYGVLALDNPESIEYLHKIRRPSKKPFLRLLPDLSYLEFYGFYVDNKIQTLANIEGLSIVLKDEEKNLGFRIPTKGFIKELLDAVKSPILAPSCNKEGELPATSIDMAVGYFKDEIPLYIDAGIIESPPSTILQIHKDKISILREGTNIELIKELIRSLA